MLFPKLIVVAIFFMISAVSPAFCADIVMEKSLPAVACAEGWTMDGKVTLFDKNTLFDRINGESELYFPYGFEKLAYARYENKQDPKIAVDADVYKMGSLLDAFGMFANYRRKDDADIAIGAQGTISSSQVFFYQDRYFVRLQVTGATSISPEVFRACARAVSQNLPGSAGRPKELDSFAIPAIVKKSERYVAQSLLGYDFFRRGLIADALLNNEQVQVFIVTGQSGDIARKTFDQYHSYLKTSGSDVRLTDLKGRASMEAIDPLYGKALVELAGRFIIGVVRIKDVPAAKRLVEQLRTRMSAE
jgi:hypothetical protein